MTFGRLLAHVGVERIARERGEMLDVFERDGPLGGVERVPDLEVLEVVPERVLAGVVRGRALDPFPRDLGQHGRRALKGGALHVVMDRTDAAELLAAAR